MENSKNGGNEKSKYKSLSIEKIKEIITFCKKHRILKCKIQDVEFEFTQSAYLTDEVTKSIEDHFKEPKDTEVDEFGLTPDERRDLEWSAVPGN